MTTADTIRAMVAWDRRHTKTKPNGLYAIRQWMKNCKQSIKDYDDYDQEPSAKDVVRTIRVLGEQAAADEYNKEWNNASAPDL